MTQKLSDEEYFKSLPKKQVGTAVIFFNNNGEILILKPNYKDAWLTPGGSCDSGESPLMCAIRETKEEIGLFVPDLKLVGIYHSPSKGMHSDSLKFIFSGGTLSDEQISNINLQKEECDEYSFMDPSTAISLLSNSLKNSVPLCLEAIKKNTVAYIDA